MEKIISTRVPEPVLKKLNAEAAKNDWKLAHLLRRILVDWAKVKK